MMGLFILKKDYGVMDIKKYFDQCMMSCWMNTLMIIVTIGGGILQIASWIKEIY